MSNDVKAKIDGLVRREIAMGDSSFARRIITDGGDSGFYNARECRISYEFTLDWASSQVRVLKFISPMDFMLKSQTMSCDQGGIIFRAYRSTQGSEGGTFSTTVPSYLNNFMSEAPSYTPMISITTGGTFTPDGGQPSVETIRQVANIGGGGPTSGSRNTVQGGVSGVRGLAAGTYYLTFSIITGVTVDSIGVYDLVFEERET